MLPSDYAQDTIDFRPKKLLKKRKRDPDMQDISSIIPRARETIREADEYDELQRMIEKHIITLQKEKPKLKTEETVVELLNIKNKGISLEKEGVEVSETTEFLNKLQSKKQLEESHKEKFIFNKEPVDSILQCMMR